MINSPKKSYSQLMETLLTSPSYLINQVFIPSTHLKQTQKIGLPSVYQINLVYLRFLSISLQLNYNRVMSSKVYLQTILWMIIEYLHCCCLVYWNLQIHILLFLWILLILLDCYDWCKMYHCLRIYSGQMFESCSENLSFLCHFQILICSLD